MVFSILIPTWNNLAYLQLCIKSIQQHSISGHEIIIHVNEGHDGTLEWVIAQGFKYSHSEKNIGVCLSVNHLATMASKDWIVFINDDMFVCPNWDRAFIDVINASKSDLCLLSSTLIEPCPAGNPHVVVQDFGASPAQFSEEKLLASYLQVQRQDVLGSSLQPTLIHRKWWHIVGGYSIEFGPGMSSDDDLLMKLWVVGCRHFRIVGASRVYHFGCKSTGRIRKNRGGRVFVMKWGITQREFYKNFLSKADGESSQSSSEPDKAAFPAATLSGKAKRLIYGLFGNYPLGEIAAWDQAPGKHLK